MGTITKALDLLTHFSAARPEIGLSQFVRLSGRDKATVHRHLTELEANGYLEQNPVSRAYRLGPALLRLAAVREAASPTRDLLRPIVADLAESVGDLQTDGLSSVCHADPRLHGTQVHFDEAEILPFHATASGLAVLAFADPDLTERVLSRPLSSFTDRTILDARRLRRMIEEVRETGFSQLVGTFDDEVASQAAPVFGAGGRVIGAIAVAVPAVRAPKDRLQQITADLSRAARAASRSLGGTYPNLPTAAPRRASA